MEKQNLDVYDEVRGDLEERRRFLKGGLFASTYSRDLEHRNCPYVVFHKRALGGGRCRIRLACPTLADRNIVVHVPFGPYAFRGLAALLWPLILGGRFVQLPESKWAHTSGLRVEDQCLK